MSRTHGRVTPKGDTTHAPFTAKKHKVKSPKKKKSKKPFPINPVQDQNITPKSPRKKTKKKPINKASSLIRHSPRFSNRPRTKIPKPKTPSKSRKKRKKARTNSSSVYKFIDYDSYIGDSTTAITESDHDSDYHSNTDTNTDTREKLSLSAFTNNDSSELNQFSFKKRCGRTPRGRSQSLARNRLKMKRSLSVGKKSSNNSNTNTNTNANERDTPLLKRLKTENKQLRKSRNELYKENSILSKVERKLRHKLDMILTKFKQIQIDFIEDGTDWNKLQKKGDIEGVLDAVFMKFNLITDQFMKQQKMYIKWNKLKSEWKVFGHKWIETGNSKELDKMDKMFEVLGRKFREFDRERKSYAQKDKRQQSEIDELEEKMLLIIEKNEKLRKQKSELSDTQKQFENEKQTYTQKLTETETKMNEYKQSNLVITSQLQSKTTAFEEYKRECETLQEFKEKLVSENIALVKRNQELDGLKSEHLMVTQSLSQVQAEINGLQDEFRVIYKRKKKVEAENSKLNSQITELETMNNKPKSECGTQTDFGHMIEDAHIKALKSENAYLMRELDALIAERSRFKQCASDTDYHKGDISSMVVSPVNYSIITGGKQDNSLRIWQPKSTSQKGGIEIKFVPKKKALIDGCVLNVAMSSDGVLLGVGASLKATVNGYVIIYNMKDKGSVYCNLRSRTLLRFGKVHCVRFMKYDKAFESLSRVSSVSSKSSLSSVTSSGSVKHRKSSNSSAKRHGSTSKGLNYLVFCGDTTGMILCWNLGGSDCVSAPVCVINGHSDIVYDMRIVENKWLFSVSHDQSCMYANIGGFKAMASGDNASVEYVFSQRLYSDESKYALKSIEFNESENELIFGSRKCNIFELNDDEKSSSEDEEQKKYFGHKKHLNTKDLDHICGLKKRGNLMIIQRTGINYVKVFNLDVNKVVKTYQIDDGHNDSNKFKIYDCGITFDEKYAILCVGVFNKENLSNLELNRSALKGFKIPRPSKK